MKVQQNRYYDRELSWLSFNHRVLQEAEKKEHPLMERIKFLAIYSSNMDEFYRVRVASLRSLLALEKETRKVLFFNPKQIIRAIHDEVATQQLLFGEVFRNDIVPELRKLGIFLMRNEELDESQLKKVRKYFQKELQNIIEIEYFEPGKIPELKDGRLYLAIRMRSAHIDASQEEIYAVATIPSHKVSRFFTFKERKDYYVLFLGDVVRVGVEMMLPAYEILGYYAVKMSRDAELHIDDEYSGDLVQKIKDGLEKRKKGVPMRFLYDVRMPEDMLGFFKQSYKLQDVDLIPGGRYHSLNDFFSFPNPENRIPAYPSLEPVQHPYLPHKGILDFIERQDALLHFPYQSFSYLIEALNEAAQDPEVTDIKITLYRVAANSKIIEALITAAQNGKRVTAFVEVKARFNEAENLFWASKMEKAGIRVLYSIPAIKVHAKLCLIVKQQQNEQQYYGYFGTGNLNEKTAGLYTDLGLLTTDKRLTHESMLIFHTLEQRLHVFEDEQTIPVFEHLLVAPLDLRVALINLIEQEIENAQRGEKAHIILKMNSMDDFDMIEKLYEASRAGVQIDLIIRGICCLIPGIRNQSERIRVRSIVGRYLEHVRAFYFYQGGKEAVYLSSADWMGRNLDRRIEVAFPVYDANLKQEVLDMLVLQLRDNFNARIIDKRQSNAFSRPRKTEKRIDCHVEIYRYLQQKVHANAVRRK